MLKIKLFLKGMIKYPTSLVLNTLSLVISFTGIIILVLYVSYQNSFDDFNENIDQIYKVNIGQESFTVPAKIAPVIKDSIVGIDAITALWFTNFYVSTPKLKTKNISYFKRGIFANSEIFDIFTFPLLLGEKKDILKEVNTIVLTEDLRQKIFENENPIGKEVLLNGDSFRVTGVMKDIVDNASFHVQYICSFATISQKPDDFPNKWSEWSFQVFCKLNKHSDPDDLEKKIYQIQEIKENISALPIGENQPPVHLDPLKQLHFSNNANFVIVNKKVLNVLSLLAIILTIMGMVNFINLTTAQAFKKFKILSIRRIFGANKKNVILLVVLESIIISMVAIGFSLWLHRLLSPFIQDMLRINGLYFGERWRFYFYFILMAFIFGVLGGLYSAFYINSPPLAHSIGGFQHFKGKGRWFRDSLIVLQFVFAIVLIVISIGINRQINYWHNFDIGIQKENVIYINVSSEIQKHHKAFAEELRKNKDITEHTYSNFVPGGVGMSWGRNVDGQQLSFVCWPVDEHFLDFFHIEIVQGRPFSTNMQADKGSFIFNKKAIETFEWDNPLEKRIFGFQTDGPVVGVSKNFNFASLKENIQPMAFWLYDGRRSKLLLKLNSSNYTQTIAYIKEIWEKFDPAHDFTYSFLDQSLEDLYQKEERISNFIAFASLWSILLALTGLLGIVIFTARNRTKEIGIRKVNGAMVYEIVKMLNFSFLKWVLIAFVIATPISYYFLKKWLNEFPYRMDIQWWIFAFAGLLVVLVTMLVISWNSFRVARQNPVDSLRYE
jgi:putative ABC transport system permease protein